jgi:hypothetical protein
MEIANELDAVCRDSRGSLRYISRIKSYALVVAQVAQQRQKLAFPAPNLNNLFVV